MGNPHISLNCICVCLVYVFVLMCSYASLLVNFWISEVKFDYFYYHTPHYFLRRTSSLNLELAIWAKPASQWPLSSWIYLSLSSAIWLESYTRVFVDSGDPNSGFHTVNTNYLSCILSIGHEILILVNIRTGWKYLTQLNMLIFINICS